MFVGMYVYIYTYICKCNINITKPFPCTENITNYAAYIFAGP